jgi:probable blue pigment (indigoidine) exporter
MVVVTAGWGVCFVAIRYGLADAPVLWFAALRALFAGAAMAAVAAGIGRIHLPRQTWPLLAAMAVVNIAVAFAAMFAGTAGIATGVAAVLANAQPLLIVVPAWLLFRERPQRRTLIGLLAGFAGLAVAASSGGAGKGALFSLGAAAAITAGTVLTRRLRGVDVLAVTGWQFLLGGLILLVWAVAAEGAPRIEWSGRFVASLAFLTVIGTVVPYLLWFVEVQRAELVSVTAWTMLTPVFGVVAGVIVLGERLGARQLIGVALVLAALPLVQLRRRGKVGSIARTADAPRRSSPSRLPAP